MVYNANYQTTGVLTTYGAELHMYFVCRNLHYGICCTLLTETCCAVYFSL